MMMMMHPRERTLIRFAEGSLNAPRRERVARHLADCARCRAVVLDVRALDEAARALPDPGPSTDALERILARRDAGARVILPVAPARVRAVSAARPALRLAAAFLGVLLVGSLLLFRAPVLTAQASELRIAPERARAGARLSVEYIGSAGAANVDRLTLRARLRTAADGAYNRSERPRPVATLVRGGDGTYRGEFGLPDSVVYALLVVEREDGTIVDHNGRRGWEVLVYGADDKPLPLALVQRSNDMMGRDWEEAHRSIVRLTQLHPDYVDGWHLLAFFEQQLFGDVDSLRAPHRARLARLDESLSARAVTGDEAGMMLWYARGAEDTVREARWRRRLIAEHPGHPLAVQERVSDLMQGFREATDKRPSLAAFEALWQEVGPRHSNLPLVGGFVAQAVGDTAAIRTWADRYAAMTPGNDGLFALIGVPGMGEEVKRRLRARIALLSSMPDSARGLFETRQEFADRTADSLRDAYAQLGGALLEDGARGAGLDTLALAIRGGWDPDLFRTVADARLAAGDSAGALELWAKAAVDPAVDTTLLDTVRVRLGYAPDPALWSRLTAAGRAEMRERVLEDARNRALGRTVRLLDAAGREHELDDIAESRPTVVVFWSRHCGPALESLPAIVALASRLEARGAGLVLITEEQSNEELMRLLAERAPGVTLYHDQWRDATLAFQSWGTPQYFVLDANGRLRFEYSEPEQLLRQVDALAAAPRTATVGG